MSLCLYYSYRSLKQHSVWVRRLHSLCSTTPQTTENDGEKDNADGGSDDDGEQNEDEYSENDSDEEEDEGYTPLLSDVRNTNSCVEV